MRKSADWMALADDRILEFVDRNGPASAKQIDDTETIPRSHSTISRRMGRLAEHGLLQPLGNGVYQLTDDGEAYLHGDLDASELEPE